MFYTVFIILILLTCFSLIVVLMVVSFRNFETMNPDVPPEDKHFSDNDTREQNKKGNNENDNHGAA